MLLAVCGLFQIDRIAARLDVVHFANGSRPTTERKQGGLVQRPLHREYAPACGYWPGLNPCAAAETVLKHKKCATQPRPMHPRCSPDQPKGWLTRLSKVSDPIFWTNFRVCCREPGSSD
ncbi:hypothetical protein L209DRAFT_151426 [Thermothelomyces heterothallicus CBS 203.75]